MVTWLLAGALAAPVELTLAASVRDGLEHDAYEALLRDFEAAHPDTRVRLVTVQWRGWDAHDTLLRFGALQDPFVDVLLLDTPWLPELARPGWLRPLDEVLQVDAFEPAALQGGRYDGRLYGVPLSLKGNALYYRADLLDEAGLAPPRTLDELTTAARILAPKVEVPLALHHDYLHNDLLPMLAGSGGGIGDGEGPHLDHPANHGVMERVASWFVDEPAITAPLWWQGTAGDYTAPDRRFGEGDAAFLISWSVRWRLAQGPDSPVRGKVGVTAVPGLRDGEGGSTLGSWYLAVASASRHPDEATELVRHLTSVRSQRQLLEQLGEVPSRRALLDDEELRRAHPQLDALAPVLRRAVLRPQVSDGRGVGEVVEAALHGIVRGAEVQGTLQEAQQLLAARWEGPLEPWEPGPVWSEPVDEEVPWGGVPLGLAMAATALLWLTGLGVARTPWGRRRLGGLAPRMVLAGGAGVVTVAALLSALAAGQLARQQALELQHTHRVLRQALEAQALATGRDLALAASLLVQPSDPAASEPALRQLLLARHFTEGLLGLQWVDRAGRVVHDADQGLFDGRAPPEPPADLGERVARGTLLMRSVQRPQPALEVLVPVVASGRHAGSLRLLVSQQPYLQAVAEARARHRQARRDLMVLVAAVTGGVLVLAWLALLWGARRLTDPLRRLTVAAARVGDGERDVEVPREAAGEVGELGRAMAAMVEGLAERDFVRDTFGRYLTPQLASTLLDDPEALQLGGSLRQVTILMSDLRGFTSLSERMGPQATVSLLNRYLGRMTEIIVEEGGTIDEFLGDAILVLFGAPVGAPDDAERALRCARRMQEAMAEVNADNERLGLPPLEMGVGLCTGEVVAGNIGSAQRAKYGVVGDPVNTAARIEGLTVGGQVLLDEATARAAGALQLVGPPQRVAVKGKRGELVVYELDADDDGNDHRVVAMALPARLEQLLGKRVGGAEQRVQLLARRGRRVRIDAELAPFTDLRLMVDWPDGPGPELYGKVVRSDADGSWVHLTGGDPTERERLLSA
jgi:ABC-type glycerol-3-phosphate transport system substrate-binding protein/class 3 adenylate cyclase